MDLKAKLIDLQKSEQKLFTEYASIIKEYETDSLTNENKKLRKENEERLQELIKLKADFQALLNENNRLKVALQEQILDEKLNILKVSRRKLETYFADQDSAYQNSLTSLEIMIKGRLLKLKEAAKLALASTGNDFYSKLAQLELEFAVILRQQETKFREEQQNLKEVLNSRMGSLESEKVTPEIVEKRARQNQWEMKVGLNWINKIGILLILCGVGAAFNYSYNWMNDYLKGICFFLLGGLFLTGGEWLYRKRRTIFSMGLLGGGIAILYGSVFYCYFGLKIINLDLGLSLSVLVTLTAVVLAIRYNSATIGALALTGGYLPFLSLVFIFGGLSSNNFGAAMGYLFSLNLLMLLISLWKRWPVVNYISFLFNVPSMIYLVFNLSNVWAGIIYSALTFLMYLAITLAYPIKNKTAIKIPDVILLGINTLANSLILFLLFTRAGFGEYRGIMALVFCLIYLGLGRLIRKTLQSELNTLILFYTTALTFAVLIIPFQFGISWLSMGWLVEGVLLAIFGFRTGLKGVEWAGWGIFLLCLSAFGLVDYLPTIFGFGPTRFFDLKYLSIIAGEILVLLIYLFAIAKNQLSSFSRKGRAITYYKYFTIFSTWLYLIYTGSMLYNRLFPKVADFSFYYWILFALISIGLGYLIASIKILYDKVIKGFSIFLYLLGDLICICLNLALPVLKPEYADNTALEYLAVFILLLYNLFVFGNIRSLTLGWLRQKNWSLETYPLLLGVYLLGNITAFLIVQFHLGSANLLFSFIYLVVAIGFIIYGFARRFIYIRRFGLGLTLFATAKLFIYDLSFLNSLGKIIAYFGFGVVLLAISFIYQKVKNSLEDHNDAKSI